MLKDDYHDNRLSDEQEDAIWKSTFDRIKKYGIESLNKKITPMNKSDISFSVPRFKSAMNSFGLDMNFKNLNAMICENIYGARIAMLRREIKIEYMSKATGLSNKDIKQIGYSVMQQPTRTLEQHTTELNIDYSSIMYNLYINLLSITSDESSRTSDAMRFALDMKGSELKHLSGLLKEPLPPLESEFELSKNDIAALVILKRKGIDTEELLYYIEKLSEQDASFMDVIRGLTA